MRMAPLTPHFTYTVSDGIASSTPGTLTINVTRERRGGSSADVRNLTETNAPADISTSGTLTISDVDSAATFVAQTNTAGNYGTFSIDAAGAWSYAASSAHDEFVAGTTYTDTFNVASADGTATSVTINILGSNDAPVITTEATQSVAENTTLVAALTSTDADTAGTTRRPSPSPAGRIRRYLLSPAATWCSMRRATTKPRPTAIRSRSRPTTASTPHRKRSPSISPTRMTMRR